MQYDEYQELQKEYKDPNFKELFRPLPSVHHLSCPECSNEVLSSDINIDKAIAKCSSCHSVFSFEDQVTDLQKRRRPEIFQPEGIELLRLSSELSIDFKWRKMNSLSVFMVFFTIVWNLFLIPFVLSAIMSGQLFILLFISLHLLVGAGLIFNLVSNLLNTTYITLDDHQLSIEHRPLKNPFYPDKHIDVKDINQLYVKKYVSSRTNGVPNHAFGLFVKLKNSKEIKLIKGLKNPDKALFLEQEIEEFLEIKDKEVIGEV